MAATQMAKFKSREYLDLVKSIGECKSKVEEDAIMKNEVLFLKQKLSDPKVEKSKMREYLVRLLYVELLGHDASFGHIHAVKLCSDSDLVNKKVAYLTTCLFLSENSELLILLMNTMKSDLHSDNYLVVCAALETLCHLATEDAVPLILPSIKELITHNKELVRKKAVMALHRFYLKAPHLIVDYGAMCRKVLCDHDPSVMGAALCALYEGIKRDPTPYKNLVKSLLHVLAQIVDRRLPKSYDNHRAPAPFLQIKVLKMLALLGQGDKAASSQMHPVILSCLKSANSGTGIGNALVYECVRTAIAIHPDANLLTASAAMVAHFLNSSHVGTAATAANNLKYVALDALGGIVQIDPSYGEKHQLSVIDCLEDPDETLKKKTLELLYRMTTTDNVEIVVEKMLNFLEQTSDEHIRVDVATRVSELAEQYAPDNNWFIDTMNKVFELAGDLVRPELADDLMQLIAEGTGDKDVDIELRKSAVESYIELLDTNKSKIPKLLLVIVAWVLGEYGSLCLNNQELMQVLVQVGNRQGSSDSVKAYIITALCKVCCQGGAISLTEEANGFISKMLVSKNLDLQQRAMEFRGLVELSPEVKQSVMPVDASCEEVEASSLTTLNDFVNQALAAGAAPYIDIELRDGLGAGSEGLGASMAQEEPGLKYENTEQPIPEPTPLSSILGPSDSMMGGGQAGHHQQPQETLQATSTGPQLNISGPRKWGRPPPAAAVPQQVPVAAAAAMPMAHEQQQHQPYQQQQQQEQYVPEPEPVQVIPDEKAQLAQSLFGGGGGSRRRGGRGQAGRSSAQQHRQASQAQSAPVAQEPLADLLGGADIGAATNPQAQMQVQPQQPQVQAEPLMDLLGGVQSSGGVGGGDPLMDLLGNPQQTPAAAVPPMMTPAQMGVGMHSQQQQQQQMMGMTTQGRTPPPAPKNNDPFKDLLG